MTTGTSLPSDFTPVPQIFNAYMSKAFVTRALENNCIGSNAPVEVINTPLTKGEFTEHPYIKRAVSANKRDVTSNSALTAVKLEGGNNRGVLMRRRSDLYEYTDDISQMGLTREQASAELGRQTGEVIADELNNVIIAALIGIVEAFTASAHTSSVWATGAKTLIDPDVLDGARHIMGDRKSLLRWFLTHSDLGRDLNSDAISRSYPNVGGVALNSNDPSAVNTFAFSRTYIDNANFIEADGGFDKYKMLLLGPGVLRMGFAKPVEIEQDRRIDRETKTSQWRADWDLYLECPFFSFTGSANPTIAALALLANWTVGYENHKECPLVELVVNYSGGS